MSSEFANANRLLERREGERTPEYTSVVKTTQRLPPSKAALGEWAERLGYYLTTNQGRIDYHDYLQQDLMIGSGVIESSNRRIIIQRLKQSDRTESLKVQGPKRML